MAYDKTKLMKNICFYMPSRILGGCEMLFIRAANYLSLNTDKKIFYIDYPDGISAEKLNEKVCKITYDKKVKLEDNTVIIAPVTLSYEIPAVLNKNTEFLFWNLHPKNLQWLSSRANLKISSVVKFVKKIISNNGLISMDGAVDNALYQTANCRSPIVPVMLGGNDFEYKEHTLKENELNIVWLSRLDYDKIYSLINLMENFKNYKTDKKKILHIIGDGCAKNEINREYYSKFFEIKETGTIDPMELSEYLSYNADCLFSMGTSLLEAAKLGIPSVLCFLRDGFSSDNSFVAALKLEDYLLGCDREFPLISDKTETLDNILDEIQADYNKYSYLYRKYFNDNFLIDNQINKLIYSVNVCKNKICGIKRQKREFGAMKFKTQKIIDFVLRKNKTVKFFKRLQRDSKRKFLIFVSSYSYFRDMVQRPNHLFELFIKEGYTILWSDENIVKPLEVAKDIWLYPMKDSKSLVLSKKIKDKLIMSISTHYTFKNLENILLTASKKGIKVIYEHIDDIGLIADEKIRCELQKRLEKICADKNIVITASAEVLYKQAENARGEDKNIIMAKNAVNPNHYKENNLDERFLKLLEKKQPIIGYYGCIFPEWFDFDLVKYAIEKNPDLSFVFIGPHNEKSVSLLEGFPNFLCLDKMPYEELRRYAKFFTAATIPFLLNEITKATSPVKLFEYMALGLPAVTTPLNECLNYKTPLIAHNKEEYCALLKKAVELKNDFEFQKQLEEESLQNSWQNTYEKIKNAIG